MKKCYLKYKISLHLDGPFLDQSLIHILTEYCELRMNNTTDFSQAESLFTQLLYIHV